MNADVKAWWIAELRSGKRKQTTATLAETDYTAFCCLGVLCELAVERGVIFRDRMGDCDGYRAEGDDMLSTEVLPDAVLEWAGLGDDNPVVKGSGLAEINDNGASFAYIADLIEEHL